MVVDLHHVDVFTLHACHVESVLCGACDIRIEPVCGVEWGVVVCIGLGDALHVDGLAFQVTRALGRHHDQCAAAVGHQATIALAQWVGDQGRGHHFFDAGGLASVGLGIELCPAAGRYGNFGQIFGCAAVAVCVQLRDHGVVANRAEVSVGQDELAARRVWAVCGDCAAFA